MSARCILLLLLPTTLLAETWRGLEIVTPENRCSEYDRGEYHYDSASLRQALLDDLPGSYVVYYETGEGLEERILGWHSGRLLHPDSVDVDHVVALSEAHDSGLCARPEDRRAFASDPLNLVLTDPAINHSKGDRDAGEWLPEWEREDGRASGQLTFFAQKVIAVKQKWGLSIDCNERTTLESIVGPEPIHDTRPPWEPTELPVWITAEEPKKVISTRPTIQVGGIPGKGLVLERGVYGARAYYDAGELDVSFFVGLPIVSYDGIEGVEFHAGRRVDLEFLLPGDTQFLEVIADLVMLSYDDDGVRVGDEEWKPWSILIGQATDDIFLSGSPVRANRTRTTTALQRASWGRIKNSLSSGANRRVRVGTP